MDCIGGEGRMAEEYSQQSGGNFVEGEDEYQEEKSIRDWKTSQAQTFVWKYADKRG